MSTNNSFPVVFFVMIGGLMILAIGRMLIFVWEDRKNKKDNHK